MMLLHGGHTPLSSSSHGLCARQCAAVHPVNTLMNGVMLVVQQTSRHEPNNVCLTHAGMEELVFGTKAEEQQAKQEPAELKVTLTQ